MLGKPAVKYVYKAFADRFFSIVAVYSLGIVSDIEVPTFPVRSNIHFLDKPVGGLNATFALVGGIGRADRLPRSRFAFKVVLMRTLSRLHDLGFALF